MRRRPFLRRRREEGAIAVEAALVIPLLVVLAFGMIELALLARDYIGATTLARAGARVAAAEPRFGTLGSPFGHDGVGTESSFAQDAADAMERSASTLPREAIEEIWVYLANSDGLPGVQTSANAFSICPPDTCVRYRWDESTVPGRFTWQGGTWDPDTINACIGDPGVQSVGVYARVDHPWLFGVFNGGGTKVTASTVMRFEPLRTTDPVDPDPTTVDNEALATATRPGLPGVGCK